MVAPPLAELEVTVKLWSCVSCAIVTELGTLATEALSEERLITWPCGPAGVLMWTLPLVEANVRMLDGVIVSVIVAGVTAVMVTVDGRLFWMLSLTMSCAT